MNKTAIFIGHRECWGVKESLLESIIINLIENGIETFLSGGMGNFDWLSANILYHLKEKYPKINNILVIPYLNFSIRNKKIFDEIIYPEGFEKYHFKAAIIKRNQYMVEHASYAVCYVEHGWGGAAKTYEYAKKRGLNIINIGNYLY